MADMDNLKSKTLKFNAGLLAAERRRRGITQAEIAERIGYTRQHVNRAEKGLGASFTLVSRLCKELEMPIADIVPDLAEVA